MTDLRLHYEAEYAKTGRSGCKECKQNISKGSLRIGVMSTLINVTPLHWHHEKCFFKKGSPASVAEINNFNKLTRADRKRIQTTIKKSVLKRTDRVCFADTDKSEFKHYLVEYSRSNLATCKHCNTKISKGEVRICKAELGRPNFQYGLWHHVKCFAERRGEFCYFAGGENLPGFQSLKKDDQDMLKNEIKPLKSEDVLLKTFKEEPNTEEELKEENKNQNRMEKQSKPYLKYRNGLSEAEVNSQENCSRKDNTQNHGTQSQTLKINRQNFTLTEEIDIKIENAENLTHNNQKNDNLNKDDVVNGIIVTKNTKMHKDNYLLNEEIDIKSEIDSYDEMDSDETFNHKNNHSLNKDIDTNETIVNKNTKMHKINDKIDIKSEKNSYDEMNSGETYNLRNNHNLNEDVDMNEIIFNKNTEVPKNSYLLNEEIDIKSERDYYDDVNSDEDINIDGKDDGVKGDKEDINKIVANNSGLCTANGLMNVADIGSEDDESYKVESKVDNSKLIDKFTCRHHCYGEIFT